MLADIFDDEQIERLRALAKSPDGRRVIDQQLRRARLSATEAQVLRMRIGLPPPGPSLAERYPDLADKISEPGRVRRWDKSA